MFTVPDAMSVSKSAARRRLGFRVLAVLLGILVAALGGEVFVRIARPYSVGQAGMELQLFRGNQQSVRRLFRLDVELGYVPILGTESYDADGFLRHGHTYELENKGDRERILFLGDSVTRRGKIVQALRREYGEEEYEYWNAGVTAYNTTQEVSYYERYARKADPDHIVLTFHLNDFYHSPISFVDHEGRMQVISPYEDLSGLRVWLFEHSHAYRFYLGRTSDKWNLAGPSRDIVAALERLESLAEEGGARLSVIVLPNLQALEDWHGLWRKRYDRALAIMEELGLRYFTLLEPLQKAIADGVDPEEAPGDTEHPSAAVAAYFGRFLKERKLLDG